MTAAAAAAGVVRGLKVHRLISGELNMTMLDMDAPMPRAPIPPGTAVNVQNLRTAAFKMGECCELSPVTVTRATYTASRVSAIAPL